MSKDILSMKQFSNFWCLWSLSWRLMMIGIIASNRRWNFYNKRAAKWIWSFNLLTFICIYYPGIWLTRQVLSCIKISAFLYQKCCIESWCFEKGLVSHQFCIMIKALPEATYLLWNVCFSFERKKKINFYILGLTQISQKSRLSWKRWSQFSLKKCENIKKFPSS